MESSAHLGDFITLDLLGLHIDNVDLVEVMGKSIDRRDDRLDSTMVSPQMACLMMTYPSHWIVAEDK
jgi:hypothetical protein